MKSKYAKQLLYGILIIIALYLLGIFFWDDFVKIITQVPVFKKIYELGSIEIQRRSVIGLSLMTFMGSLFFIGYPAELLFLIYIRAGYGFLYVSLIMLFYTMLAQTLNYGIGYFIEEKVLQFFVKGSREDFLKSLAKYDVLFIIVLNILPLPADILSVILGMIKYPFKKGMLYTVIGKILKFVFLGVLVFVFRAFY